MSTSLSPVSAMSYPNPPPQQSAPPPPLPQANAQARIPDATKLQIKLLDCNLDSHPTNLLIEEAFGAFAKDMSCVVPRSVDIDSAELIVRCVFNRLVIVLRAPYLDAIRTLDQRVMLADRQNPTPLLHGLMDRTTPRLCTLKETHHEAIIDYQSYIIAYTRSIRASERKYQGTLIMHQKSQHNAAQSIGALYQKLSAELEAHQRSIITTNDLIAGVKRVGQTDFAADPTDAARLEALRKYQDQLLFHQATMITNALNITAFEEKTRSMIAARQVHVLKTAREIAELEARHEAAFTGHKAEIKAQGAALMRLVYCQHAELERARVKLMDIVEIVCPIVVAAEGGGNPDSDGECD